MKQHCILGIDIGGTGIKGAIVDVDRGVFLDKKKRVSTPQPANNINILKTVNQLINHFDWKGPVGFGFPSVIKNGIALTAANLDKEWINSKIEKTLSKGTGQSCFVLNDADAAGLAEVKFGNIPKRGVVLFLTLGTGIGSALFHNGQLVKNTELGHLRFHHGTAEQFASNGTRKEEDLSWEDWANRLNELAHHINRLFFPDLIILGGGLSKPSRFANFESLLDFPMPFAPSQLQNEAGIIGAAVYAKERLKQMKKGLL